MSDPHRRRPDRWAHLAAWCIIIGSVVLGSTVHAIIGWWGR